MLNHTLADRWHYLRAQIANNPETYDQQMFGCFGQLKYGYCNTPCCIAGHAFMLACQERDFLPPDWNETIPMEGTPITRDERAFPNILYHAARYLGADSLHLHLLARFSEPNLMHIALPDLFGLTWPTEWKKRAGMTLSPEELKIEKLDGFRPHVRFKPDTAAALSIIDAVLDGRIEYSECLNNEPIFLFYEWDLKDNSFGLVEAAESFLHNDQIPM